MKQEKLTRRDFMKVAGAGVVVGAFAESKTNFFEKLRRESEGAEYGGMYSKFLKPGQAVEALKKEPEISILFHSNTVSQEPIKGADNAGNVVPAYRLLAMFPNGKPYYVYIPETEDEEGLALANPANSVLVNAHPYDGSANLVPDLEFNNNFPFSGLTPQENREYLGLVVQGMRAALKYETPELQIMMNSKIYTPQFFGVFLPQDLLNILTKVAATKSDLFTCEPFLDYKPIIGIEHDRILPFDFDDAIHYESYSRKHLEFLGIHFKTFNEEILKAARENNGHYGGNMSKSFTLYESGMRSRE